MDHLLTVIHHGDDEAGRPVKVGGLSHSEKMEALNIRRQDQISLASQLGHMLSRLSPTTS